MGEPMNTALVQVLGAVAYGELKAYELARAEADSATTPAERRRHRIVAAEELRHHEGFVGRLEAMGADPGRAMRPFRTPLDRYHAYRPADPVESAAAADLKSVLDSQPGARARAVVAAARMVGHMLWSGRAGAPPLTAFLRVGRADALITALIAGQQRRLRAVL